MPVMSQGTPYQQPNAYASAMGKSPATYTPPRAGTAPPGMTPPYASAPNQFMSVMRTAQPWGGTNDAQRGYTATQASAGPYAAAPYGGAGGKNNKYASNAWEQGNFRSRTMGALDTTQGQANTGNQAFLDRSLAYDPSKQYNDYMQGAWGQMYNGPNGLKQQLQDLAGSSVGRGRLDTGFYDTDNGMLIRNALNDYSNTAKTGALQTSALGLQNNAALGQFGQNQQNNYLDLLSGTFDRMQGDQARANAAKGATGKAIGGVIGSVAPYAAAALL